MKRESNYDLLRIMAAFAVIIIHIVNVYYQALTDVEEIGFIVTDNCFLIILIKSLCNFAVPCFFMMSGAFNLANERNANYKEFYSKSLKKIGIPAIIFSLMGIFYNLAMAVMKVCVLKTQSPDGLLIPIVDAAKGEPFYHLWYLSVLLGLYIVTPLLITLHSEMKRGGVNIFSLRIIIVFILLASISEVTNHHLVQWDIGKQLNYLGYYITGYTIRTKVGGKKNNFKGIMLIFIGLLSLTVMAIIKFFEMQHGKVLHLGSIEIFGWNYMTPLEIIGSLFVFWGFSTLDLKKDFSRLASYTFLIYLIHAFVWGVMHNTVMNYIYPIAHVSIVLPMAAIFVFAISLLLAVVYKKVWAMFDNKTKLSDKIAGLLYKKDNNN